MINFKLLLAFAAAALAAPLSAFMIHAIRPLLLRHALANPNARSSHQTPTPQGAGIAVIAATLIAAIVVIGMAGCEDMKVPVAVFGATLFIAGVGLADDLKSTGVVTRLLLQGLAVAAVVFAADEDLRLVPACPLWIERILLWLAGLWFVNLVNFMDGLDLMTTAEVVPVTAAVVLLGWLGNTPASTMILAASLCGALIGFFPFNRPVAKIFLGDVGSLAIGLLTSWCLLQLAYNQQFTAALLLPMYYLADATITLLRRLASRETIWAAHRSHYYQRATDNGFSVSRVVGEIFLLNVGLVALATISTYTSIKADLLCLVAGFIATCLLLYRFSRPLRSQINH
jgi:UDP-N-acetylmuramyl pentapeptide phosphotransferase/UDP-N-acetylglucosamine-1-phosphate transferase